MNIPTETDSNVSDYANLPHWHQFTHVVGHLVSDAYRAGVRGEKKSGLGAEAFGCTICGTSPGTQTARVANLIETMGRLGHSTAKASLLYQQQVSGRDVEIAEALSRLAEGVVAPDRNT